MFYAEKLIIFQKLLILNSIIIRRSHNTIKVDNFDISRYANEKLKRLLIIDFRLKNYFAVSNIYIKEIYKEIYIAIVIRRDDYVVMR